MKWWKIALLSLLLIGLSVLGYRHLVPTQELGVSDRWIPRKLAEVEAWADIIVIGTAQSRAGNKAFYEDSPFHSPGYTSSFFIIEQVIKSDNRVNDGDIIEVAEPYIEHRDLDGLYIVRPYEQQPMVCGQRYLLFLIDCSEAGFTTDLYYALPAPEMKYVWPIQLNAKSPRALEIPSGMLDQYTPFLEEVIEKYGGYQQTN